MPHGFAIPDCPCLGFTDRNDCHAETLIVELLSQRVYRWLCLVGARMRRIAVCVGMHEQHPPRAACLFRRLYDAHFARRAFRRIGVIERENRADFNRLFRLLGAYFLTQPLQQRA